MIYLGTDFVMIHICFIFTDIFSLVCSGLKCNSKYFFWHKDISSVLILIVWCYWDFLLFSTTCVYSLASLILFSIFQGYWFFRVLTFICLVFSLLFPSLFSLFLSCINLLNTGISSYVRIVFHLGILGIVSWSLANGDMIWEKLNRIKLYF